MIIFSHFSFVLKTFFSTEKAELSFEWRRAAETNKGKIFGFAVD
jgi:hypothetical protein